MMGIHTCLLNVALFATVAMAAPRLWSVEDVATSRISVGGIPIPHHKRQIIKGPGGYEFNVLEHLAGIAPYFDSPGVRLDPSPPDGCSVSKAVYLVRHSNIYANDFDFETYLSPFLYKLGNMTDKSVFANSNDLAFLANYSSPVTNMTDNMEEMTPSGGDAAAAFAGVIKETYAKLLNSSDGTLNVWAASADRDVDTANAFIKALSNGAQLVIVNEGEEDSANSLTPHESCPAFDAAMGSEQSGAWQEKYTAPIVARFNSEVPGFNFTLEDIVGMQELCGYDTVIRNLTSFCDVFSVQEWLDFEYGNDLQYFYSLGYGNPIAPNLGLPWVRAAVDILSSNDTSKYNQSLYVSFSHREEPPLALTPLGLFNNSAYYPGLDVNSTMPTDRINYGRAWRTSQILPFLGHVGLERLECTNTTAPSTSEGTNSSVATQTYVRVLVNGAPIPVPECQNGPGESCELGSFGDYMNERVALYGDFVGACGINDTVTNRTDILTIYNA